jgi:hypothetical protein
MALVAKLNGDPIRKEAYNDFRDLLTGTMQDQAVTIKNVVQVKQRGTAPGAPTAVVAAGGSVDVGAHTYVVTFVDAVGGETGQGSGVVATTTGGNQTVNLSAIATGPTGTASRKIYRSKAGTTTPLFLVTTINDNVTTTYSDTATDASLPATNPPVHPSFGGSIQILSTTGVVKAQIFADGAFSFDTAAVTSDGLGHLSSNINNLNTATDIFLQYIVQNAPETQAQQAVGILGKKASDASSRFKLFMRGTDGYGAIALAGPNGANANTLFGSATGLQTDGALIVATLFKWGAGAGGSLSSLIYSAANHENEYWTPQASGTAQGHLFIGWSGAAQVNLLSIGSVGVLGLVAIDGGGNISANSLTSNTGTLTLQSLQSGGASGVQFWAWSGAAQVKVLSLGGQFGSALSWVDISGHFFDNGRPLINANGSPTATTGNTGKWTTDNVAPGSPATGDLWLDTSTTL